MPKPAEVFERVAASWLSDPESDVVHTESVDGRWVVRMRQQVRDATTVWWELGGRSLQAEAYVLPPPEGRAADCYRLCLVRNASTWRARFALDRDGAIVVRGRIPVEEVSPDSLDALLGEIHELIELSFGPLVAMAFGREKTP